jgi:hypothetical protein
MKGEEVHRPNQQQLQKEEKTGSSLSILREGQRGLRIEPRMPQSYSVKVEKQQLFQPRLTREILDSALSDSQLQKKSRLIVFASTWNRIRNKDFRGLVIFSVIISVIIFMIRKRILVAISGILENNP